MGNSSTKLDLDTITSVPVSPRTFLVLVISWALLGLVSAGLNSAVCAMVYSDKKLRTMTNYLVVSLSIADLLGAVVFVPLYIIDHYKKTVIGGYFVAFILLATVFNLCGVTYERYVALTQPFRYRMIMSCRKVTAIVVVAWTAPLLLALLPLAWNTDVEATAHKFYLAIIVTCFIFIPCTAMVWVYVRLLSVVRHFVVRNRSRTSGGNATGQRVGNEEKAARVFAMVFAMFLLCWLPIIYINICLVFDQEKLVTNELIFVSFYTLILNSIMDPVICAFFKRDFRDAFKRRLKLVRAPNDHLAKIDSDLELRRLSRSRRKGDDASTEPKTAGSSTKKNAGSTKE